MKLAVNANKFDMLLFILHENVLKLQKRNGKTLR